MALALRRTVLAALLVASFGTAVAEPAPAVRRAPTLCVAVGGALAPLIVAGDLPDAEVVVPGVEIAPARIAIVDIPHAPEARLVEAAVLRVAPKTSPPARS